MEDSIPFIAGMVTTSILTLLSLCIIVKLVRRNRANAKAWRIRHRTTETPPEPFIKIHESLTDIVEDAGEVKKNTISEETIRRFRMRNRFYS